MNKYKFHCNEKPMHDFFTITILYFENCHCFVLVVEAIPSIHVFVFLFIVCRSRSKNDLRLDRNWRPAEIITNSEYTLDSISWTVLRINCLAGIRKSFAIRLFTEASIQVHTTADCRDWRRLLVHSLAAARTQFYHFCVSNI